MERRQRFAPTPKGATITDAKLTLAILDLLQRYRYLPSNYIPALLGCSAWYKAVLTDLYHEGYVTHPPESRRAENARYRPRVLEITRKGERFLADHGLWHTRHKTGEDFVHEISPCMIYASFEIGVKETGLELVTARDILAHPLTPAATRALDNPFAYPVAFSFRHPAIKAPVAVKTTMYADWQPFGIAYREDGKRKVWFFPGFEFDRNTEPLETKNADRSSIYRKLLGYVEIKKSGLLKERFGINNFSVPILTTNATHMGNMMALVEKTVPEAYHKLFLFKTVPDFRSEQTFMPPTGHMLTQGWKRVGVEDFVIY